MSLSSDLQKLQKLIGEFDFYIEEDGWHFNFDPMMGGDPWGSPRYKFKSKFTRLIRAIRTALSIYQTKAVKNLLDPKPLLRLESVLCRVIDDARPTLLSKRIEFITEDVLPLVQHIDLLTTIPDNCKRRLSIQQVADILWPDADVSQRTKFTWVTELIESGELKAEPIPGSSKRNSIYGN